MATKTVSIVTGGVNQAPTNNAELNAVATDFISNGVVGAITLNTGSGGTGAYAVNAQSTPNMTVRVTAGTLYQQATPVGGLLQAVRVVMTTFEDVTINANSSGATRFDWLYLVIDQTKLANPGVNKDDVATLVTSRSTSASVDNGTPPSAGYLLAVITVANLAASIVNSNISDKRVQSGANALNGSGIVSYANLLSTIFSGQIATGVNAGSAGGSTNYINVGGLKICWGITATISVPSAGATGAQIVTLPVTFTVAPTAIGIPSDNTASGSLFVYQNTSPTTTAVTFVIQNAIAAAATAKIQWLVIGI